MYTFTQTQRNQCLARPGLNKMTSASQPLLRQRKPQVKLLDGGPSSGAPCWQSAPTFCLDNQRLLRTQPNRKEENVPLCG